MMRGAAERQARAQLAQHPRGLVQPTQTQPPAVPRTPQVVPHLHQPLPGWPATQCQQPVQLPGKSTRREVMFDPSAEKTAPASSPSSQDCRRPTTRGWGDSGRSVSCPRGYRRRLVCSHCVRRAICPPDQRQVFHHQWHLKEPCLSRVVGKGPPSMIPHDWQQNFAARGGRRTLSMCSGSTTNTMLPPLRRRSGVKLKETFFTYFLPHKGEALGIKKGAQWITWHA